jgi:hypothetical protein
MTRWNSIHYFPPATGSESVEGIPELVRKMPRLLSGIEEKTKASELKIGKAYIL